MQTSAAPKTSVVIPTWQRGDLLRECLESLRRQTFTDYETILVSNGAGKWAGELAEEFHCSLVSFAHNRGFAAAVNAGIAASRSPYIAVLNDDVTLGRNWLELTAALLDERPEVSFCCGKIYQADGTLLDDAGDAISLGGSAWRLGFGRRDSEEFATPRTIYAVAGTAALFRRIVFEKVGGLDEDFFSYLEDMDFALRCARAGLAGFYLPQAACRHRGGGTSGGTSSPTVFRLLTRNQLLLLATNFPGLLLLRLAPRIAWAQSLWALMALRKHRARAYLRGVAGFLRLLPKTISKRPRWRQGERRALLARLRDWERQIYADTTAPDRKPVDTFWKMYFLLFAPARGEPASAKAAIRNHKNTLMTQ